MNLEKFFGRMMRLDDGGGGGLHDKEGFSYESKKEARKSHQAFEKSEEAYKTAQKSYEAYEDAYYGHKSLEEIKRAWEQYEIEYDKYLKIYKDTAEHYGHKANEKKDRFH